MFRISMRRRMESLSYPSYCANYKGGGGLLASRPPIEFRRYLSGSKCVHVLLPISRSDPTYYTIVAVFVPAQTPPSGTDVMHR